MTGKVSQRKKVLKRTAERVGREAVVAIKGGLRDDEDTEPADEIPQTLI